MLMVETLGDTVTPFRIDVRIHLGVKAQVLALVVEHPTDPRGLHRIW